MEKGKIPVATVSFDLKNPEKGPFARLRTPFYDQETGDIVVVNRVSYREPGKQTPVLACVTGVDWIEPPQNHPCNPSCILTYLNVKQLLKDSMESQKEAYEEAVRHNKRRSRRKQELETTVRELQKEILKLVEELNKL